MLSRRLPGLALAIHVVAALYLSRLSLWIDEASSVFFARRSVGELIVALCDPHPPGYYILLHVWLTINDGEIWLRLLSLLASLLSLLIVYRWVSGWWDTKVAMLAVALLAMQPMQVWYSAEIRMYALTQMLALLAAWLAWRMWCNDSDRRWIILYWLAATSAIWTDYTAIFSLGMVQLLWLALARPKQSRWLILQLAVFLPTGLIWLNSGQLSALGSSYQPVLIATQAANLGVTLTLVQAGLLFQLGLVAIGLAGVVMAWKWRSLMAWEWFGRNLPTLLVLLWFALLLFGAIPRLFTLKRLSLGLLPWIAIATAWALSRQQQRNINLTGILSVSALGLMLLTHQKTDWRNMIRNELPSIVTVDDRLWVDELSVPAFSYYADESLEWETLFPSQWDQLSQPEEAARLLIATDNNQYRDVATLMPDNFRATYRSTDAVDADGLRLLYFQERARPATASAEEDATTPWDAFFPSPLASCR